jgi:hypothetical protein
LPTLPPKLARADAVIEWAARAEELWRCRLQLDAWANGSFGSKRAVPLTSSAR